MARPLPSIPGLEKIVRRSLLTKWRSTVANIKRQGRSLESLTDTQLKKKSLSLQYDARSGMALDKLIVPAFALVRECAHRTIGMQHYDVQLLGGIAMFYRGIAVMQTGEGKTLTATLPMYLYALQGKGAHLATANDYLADRDAELMAPVYEALGMSVGVITNEHTRPQRSQAYQCDITYSTAKEIGFDFLRDRLVRRQIEFGSNSQIPTMVSTPSSSTPAGAENLPVQRDLNFILVDEADSILIDEARTPLIVSSTPDEVAQAAIELYRWTAKNANKFVVDQHFRIHEKNNQISLTPDGRKLVRTTPQPPLLKRTPVIDIYEQMEMAIYVNQNYLADRHYVIRDGEVVIVDEFTGRLAEGRKWRSGIHQAIEAREGLEISVETGEAARITLQDLFLKYEHLAGMTGTAANSASELQKIYQVRVVEIPTNRPPRRIRLATQIYGSDNEKWEAIADEIEAVHRTTRPVLIGTRSIDKSEILSKILADREIEHEVLNARHLEREAEIVAAAGELNRVTVATNMAGRGTDIKLSDEALAAGGLHVICSELHESTRIDRQLIGRCGRQGDPGSYRQFLSLEDDILKNGVGEFRAGRLLKYQQVDAKKLLRFEPLFHRAQINIQRHHFRARKMLLYHEKRRQEMQREMGQDPYLDTAGS